MALFKYKLSGNGSASTMHIPGGNNFDASTKVRDDLNRIELWCKDDNLNKIRYLHGHSVGDQKTYY